MTNLRKSATGLINFRSRTKSVIGGGGGGSISRNVPQEGFINNLCVFVLAYSFSYNFQRNDGYV